MQPFDRFWLPLANSARSFVATSFATSWPRFSQQDDADAVTFQLRTPGYRRRDLDVEVRDRVVTVRGDRSDGWFKRRSKTRFVYTFGLPETLDDHDVSASFADGILRLKVAKKPHARRRSIPIQTPDAAAHPTPNRATEVRPWRRPLTWLRAVFAGESRHLGARQGSP
jgi:HSP20 family protein